MTCVAFDGKVLAADRQATCSDVRMLTCKIRAIEKEDGLTAMAWTGTEASGLAMVEWHLAGADPEKFPESQKGDDWSRLIVVTPSDAFFYEKAPQAIKIIEPYYAWGSGRDHALGAMYVMDVPDAVKAVEAAIRWDVSCGYGVDRFRVRP